MTKGQQLLHRRVVVLVQAASTLPGSDSMERPSSDGAVPDEMPLSYGIVQPALNFLASLPAAPAHAAEGGAPCAERGGEASTRPMRLVPIRRM